MAGRLRDGYAFVLEIRFDNEVDDICLQDVALGGDLCCGTIISMALVAEPGGWTQRQKSTYLHISGWQGRGQYWLLLSEYVEA